ncbi:MAG: hypothetical protein HXM81_07805 [Neisseria sicca]|nr:hypothetical protein [Neisseria sicca]
MSDFLAAGAEHPQLRHRAALRRQMPFPELIPQLFIFVSAITKGRLKIFRRPFLVFKMK